MSKVKATTITAYIEAAPAETRPALYELLACIREAAPGATEGLKWGVPAFSYSRILVTFAIFKHHIGFYPTPSAVKAFEKSLTDFKRGESSIQFPLDRPLPLALIRNITLFRVQESLEGDAKWRQGPDRGEMESVY